MKLRYDVPSFKQLRRDVLAIAEAHSASTGVREERALRDLLVCLVQELCAEGYTRQHLEMLTLMAGELTAERE